MTPEQITKKVNQWLTRWAKTYREGNKDDGYWYNDCDMIDGAISDLSIEDTNSNRTLVGRIVDSYIASK